MKNHKPWFDQARSTLVDQRKQAKLLSEINGDNLKIVRCEASRYFKKK
jgi:hypothetical protein